MSEANMMMMEIETLNHVSFAHRHNHNQFQSIEEFHPEEQPDQIESKPSTSSGSGGRRKHRNKIDFGLCKVCTDKAGGVHYGIATCEGCKGFFKRGLANHETYYCYFDNKCEITPKMRKDCKACRWNKCVEAGMSVKGIKMGRISKHKKEQLKEKSINDKKIVETLKHNQLSLIDNQLYNKMFSIKFLLKSARTHLIAEKDPAQLLAETYYSNVYIDTPLESSLFVLHLLRDRAYQIFNKHFNIVVPYYDRLDEIIAKLNRPSTLRQTMMPANPSDIWPIVLRWISNYYKLYFNYAIELPGFADIPKRDLCFLVKKNIFLINALFHLNLWRNGDLYMMFTDEIQCGKEALLQIFGQQLGTMVIYLLTNYAEMKFTTNELALLIPYLITQNANFCADQLERPKEVCLLNEHYARSMLNEFCLNKRSSDFLNKFTDIVSMCPTTHSKMEDATIEVTI